MAKQQKGKEVAKRGNTALATYDYGEDAGAGFENTTREDYAIPFIGILEGLSPQLKTVEGAKPGGIINTVTDDLYDEIRYVPCHLDHCFVEWRPKRGGFVARHDLASDVVAKAKEASTEFGKYQTGDNDLAETFYVYGLLLNGDSIEQSVISFTSTRIKKYKGWMTKARSVQVKQADGRRINPPLFAHVYRLSTIEEKSKDGEYNNWQVAFDGINAIEARLAPDSDEYLAAKAFRDLAMSGATRADYGAEGSSPPAGGDAPLDDDIPF